jgi:hypothetical protein
MKLTQLLSKPLFSFPLKRNLYFPRHLELIFKKYISGLKQIEGPHSHIVAAEIDKIELTCNDILNVTTLIFEGKTIQAHQTFNNMLLRLQDHLIHPDSIQVIGPKCDGYYKARIKNSKHFERKDLFHVPFENRYAIRTNRFSVPGLPCLYLSNSIYTCWEELDRPLLSEMYVSEFKEHKKNFKYLDIVPRYESLQFLISGLNKSDPIHMAMSIATIEEMGLPRDFNLYPLLAACYTKVKERDNVFKPEYIFPQLLMQWVLNKDYLDGIKYLSTKSIQSDTPLYRRFLDTPINYAIPVKKIANQGYCEVLSKNLMLTEPISWELLNIINPSRDINLPREEMKYRIRRQSYALMGNKDRNYNTSAFGLLEDELLNMDKQQITLK